MKENMIYKGCERRVIVVKSASSKHFEEAHFFLRAVEESAASMPELLREANRIVERSLLPPVQRRSRERRKWFWRGFSIGVMALGLLLCAVWVLVALY